ncbi:MAG: 5-dehydro-4-deoxy-D-glucuronate isomerase [Bacteroidales bacterium]|nr:5-dehydro-4-deoxy-D-glucuronate isomerase [Bacteroidales bacterium]
MKTNFQVRYSSHPSDVKQYDTAKLREHFLVSNLFVPEESNFVYSHFDRMIVGGIMPVSEHVTLESIPPLRSEYFLERRELGIFNVGGKGVVTVDGEIFTLEYKEALYLGQGKRKVVFVSDDKNKPAKFYINSAPAHKSYPDRKITTKEADVVILGSLETSNHRTVNKMLVNSVLPTCQLQMGMTELKPGSVWNTMPPHVHDRRMEAYFYFEVPEGQSVCHFMGQVDETRHIWMKNDQAVISPSWSIHSAAGTNNYIFIWGMAGENLDYGDMDTCAVDKLK